MSKENKAIIRRFAEAVVHGGNLHLVQEFFADTFVVHDPSNPERTGGIEGARRFVATLHAGLSDLHYTVEDMIAEGDQVVCRWLLCGTHSGPFMGVPPAGNVLEISGIDVFRLEGGKIVESWAYVDAVTLLRQLGLLPAPPIAS